MYYKNDACLKIELSTFLVYIKSTLTTTLFERPINKITYLEEQLILLLITYGIGIEGFIVIFVFCKIDNQ